MTIFDLVPKFWEAKCCLQPSGPLEGGTCVQLGGGTELKGGFQPVLTPAPSLLLFASAASRAPWGAGVERELRVTR